MQMHGYVIGYRDIENLLLVDCKIILEVKKINIDDEAVVNELTRADVWSMSREDISNLLQQEWHCYAALHGGRIVASCFVYLGKKFEDKYMDREFILDRSEVYWWRGYTIQEYRGLEVIPFLVAYLIKHLADNYNKTRGFFFVRRSNKSMLRGFQKLGLYPLGWVGFIELFGIRFHYLWGRKALKETRKRCFVALR